MPRSFAPRNIQQILDALKKKFPDAQTELNYSTPFELLVAVILSAQCTDKRVNMVTPALFRRFPDAKSMAESSPGEIFNYIKSVSYPNSKSKNLWGTAKMLHEEFGGQVPSDEKSLIRLPGVGRKTANVIQSVLFEKPALAVDTHVFRVSARIGLTRNAKNPLQAEAQLVKIIPEKEIPLAHHLFILHGRYVCTARNPKCNECLIKNYCDFFKKQINLKQSKNSSHGNKKQKENREKKAREKSKQ
ncbi:MAG: endonuclease III [Bacteroidia bacterium]|nr:endonuclease III [Bacteroidia bacterium]